MSIEVKIRPVTAIDWAQFEMLVAGICLHHGDTHALNEQQFNQMAVGENAPVTTIVAQTEEGILAGFASGFLVFDLTKGQHKFHLHALYVMEEFRRNRIGEVLMMSIFQIVKQKYNTNYINLAAYNSNDAAINFYKQLGFMESTQANNSIRFYKEVA